MKVLTGIFLSLANIMMLINNLKIQTSLFQEKYNKFKITNVSFIALFSVICIITSYMALCDPIPLCYIFLFVIQYFSIALIPIQIFKCNIKRIVYTAMFLIFSDSLFSSAMYVIIRMIFKNPDKDLSHMFMLK